MPVRGAVKGAARTVPVTGAAMLTGMGLPAIVEGLRRSISSARSSRTGGGARTVPPGPPFEACIIEKESRVYGTRSSQRPVLHEEQWRLVVSERLVHHRHQRSGNDHLESMTNASAATSKKPS